MTPRRALPSDPISRRRLLQALGVTAGGLALPSLWRRPVRAAELGGIKNLFIMVSSHGTTYANWKMRPNAEPDDQDWEFDLSAAAQDQMSPILAPLWGLRHKTLVLDGLANLAGRVSTFNEHAMGNASILTGRVPPETGTSSGISIDQFIAGAMADPGPIRSLEYATGGERVCFNATGGALPYETDVHAAYERLFPDGPGTDAPLTDELRVARAQPSVLDLVAHEYDAMYPRLSSEDRVKLDQHRDLVRDLEAQIAALADIDCQAPEAPGATPMWGSAEYPAAMSDIYFGLIRAAFSCGVSRIATFRQGVMFNSSIDAPAGDIHAQFAHHDTEVDNDAVTYMTNYHRYDAEVFASLLTMLEATPNGTGGTLLDDTVCLWANELATGDHRFGNMPLVLAGGGSYFSLGRYVHWRTTDVLHGPYDQDWDMGPATNRLLTRIANAMGIDIPGFGDDGFPRAGGGTISGAGALDRVTI